MDLTLAAVLRQRDLSGARFGYGSRQTRGIDAEHGGMQNDAVPGLVRVADAVVAGGDVAPCHSFFDVEIISASAGTLV